MSGAAPTVGQHSFAPRVARLRDKMKAADLDAVVIYKMMGEYFPYGGIGYARYVVPWTSPPIPPALILVPSTGDVSCLLMEGLGADHLEAPIPGLTVRSEAVMAGMYRNEAVDLVRVLANVVAEAGLDGARVGFALPNELPVWLDASLRERLPAIVRVDATALLDELLMHKLAAEVDSVQGAARLADRAFETVFAGVRIGRPELELSGDAHCAVLQGGAAYADIRVATGRPGSSKHGVRPSSKKLIEPGDHVHVGVDINYEGYWANVVKRGVMGVPEEMHKQLYAIAVAMQKAAIDELVPGRTADGAARAAMQVLESAQSQGRVGAVKVQRLGHGIGLENQERPFLIQSETTKVEPGMTFAVHAGFSVIGGPQVANGDIVLVTDDGPELLTSFPADLVQIG